MTESDYLNRLCRLMRMANVEDPIPDRTGVGTYRLQFERLKWDLKESFPLLVSKEVRLSVFDELAWFIRGETNINTLGTRIWDDWADEDGNLGPVYGAQWRGLTNGVDQLAKLVRGIKEDPFGRRHIVSAWNVMDLPLMTLPPCHLLFQCVVSKHGDLSLQVYQRSGDIFLGVPFNLASYGALCHLIAHQCGLGVGELSIVFGDLHLYANHVEQAVEQLRRTRPETLPTFDCSWLEYDLTDPVETPSGDELALCVAGYNPLPPIKAPIAV